MRTRLRLKEILAGILCIIALVLWYERSPLGSWLEVKRHEQEVYYLEQEVKILERQAKENLDATELQEWAMHLMTQRRSKFTRGDTYYGTNFYSSTNFPSGLKKIDHFRGEMRIYTDDRHVIISGHGKGGPHLVVGSPSFPPLTNGSVIQWKPGIYFRWFP